MKLNLHLISAENLPAKDFSGTSDPYVKIMLLPDRKHRLVSNIRRKSLNPRWDEKFSFEGRFDLSNDLQVSRLIRVSEQQLLIAFYLAST